MKTRFVEAVGINSHTAAPGNHGKFMVGLFEPHEWARQCQVDAEMGEQRSLLHRVGWGTETHFMVSDLQTGEGSIFSLGGYAKNDLDKHAVWVCPLFEPFLAWLYETFNEWRRTKSDYSTNLDFILGLPPTVEIEHVVELSGYRRPGPQSRVEP